MDGIEHFQPTDSGWQLGKVVVGQVAVLKCFELCEAMWQRCNVVVVKVEGPKGHEPRGERLLQLSNFILRGVKFFEAI